MTDVRSTATYRFGWSFPDTIQIDLSGLEQFLVSLIGPLAHLA